MSNGATHLQASLILAAGFSAGAIISQEPRMFECAVGAMVGILISPDLDLSNGGIVGGRMIRKRIGRLGESLWKRFWNGYSSSFKHGSWGSHAPIFSTIIRLAYMYYWTIFIPHLFFYMPKLLNLSPLPNWDLMYVLSWYARYFFSLFFVYGLCSSDIIHWALDALTKEKSK